MNHMPQSVGEHAMLEEEVPFYAQALDLIERKDVHDSVNPSFVLCQQITIHNTVASTESLRTLLHRSPLLSVELAHLRL